MPNSRDRSDVDSGKQLPEVPIKTYKWEDVKRARRKGGYPWTYLDKEAFNETVDSEDFKMDGLRKNKTSSASSVSDSLEIREITEDDIKGLEGIDSSYVVIESPLLLGVHLDELMKDQEGMIESADSSDNISQYLDKEERGPAQQLESTETLTMPGPSTLEVSNGRQTERAKSEEPKRKRKLSVESNYSRISLSKLGVMKRLKDAKEKLKLPKLSTKSKKETKIVTKPDQNLQERKQEYRPNPSKKEKPVYIHIPLKPPEGEKDEFSHLEFEEKRPQAPQPIPEVQIEESIEDKSEEDKENISVVEEHLELSGSNGNDLASKSTNENKNNLGLMLPDDQEDDVSAIIFLEGEEGSENKEEYDIIAVDIDENSQEMKMSQVTNTEVRRQVLESIKKVDSQPNISGTTGGSLSRSSSKASKTSKSSIRKRRAKSVEPEKKRRGSIDSSYSRKSLSKLGLLKKLKQFHMPFVKSQSKKSVNDSSSIKMKPEQQKQVPKPQAQSKNQKPVIIHIPLKPPEGQQDEFSHLEFENAPPPQPSNETNETTETKENDIESPIETPQTAKSPQFIVLTPPSDDELLDKPDIPDTPSSETGSLFQFGELKQLAKKAVDQILEAVDEEAEQKGEKSTIITEAVVEPQNVDENKEDKDSQQVEEKKETNNGEKLTIDEEDGLKSVPVAGDEVKSKLKSNLKGESSPVPKKKVSFKRRKSSQISQVSKDDGYEEIESPSTISVNGESSAGISDPYVSGTDFIDSASADEAKSNLDTEKLAKSISLEEGVNRWSKISDHEYEPVNPPPEEKSGTNPPKSHVSEVLNPTSVQTHQYSDEELDLSVQEMQSDIESRFFGSHKNASLAATRSSEPRASPSRRSPSKRSSRSRSKEKEPAKPSRFQTAIKDSASKFKTKLQGIKKPTISLPSRPKFKKPNFKKPNINLPKLPDLSSTFRRSSKPEEATTTESKTADTKAMENAGSKGIFDFSTYPRIFKKKKRDHDSASLRGDEKEKAERRTHKVRRNEEPVIIRIPLHSEASMDQENGIYPEPEEILEVGQIETASSPSGYQEDIETDDEDVLQRERQEKHRAAVAAATEVKNSRWDHGSFYRSQNGTTEHNENVEELQQEEEEYQLEEEENQQDEEEFQQEEEEIQHEEKKQSQQQKKEIGRKKEETEPEIVTDLDLTEETQTPFVPIRHKGRLQQNDSFDTNHSRDHGSSVSSLGQHRRGVLEEIDSDQFFLREKGISQDNIDMGKYLSTEIREAFRSPVNALADMRSYNYEELRASNQSLPETKRKPVKKPKRRKTPHASQERLRYEPESENEDYNFMPPIRPKRKSKRKKRPEPETVPYVETIIMDPPESTEYTQELEDDLTRHYENDQMQGIEQPDIHISGPYAQQRLHVVDHHDAHRRASEPIPAAPPRKHKSLKSLNASEHESIFEEYERNNENTPLNGYANEEIFMTTEISQPESLKQRQMQEEPLRPPKPPTRSRSKTRSMSRTTSLADRDSILGRMDSIMFDEEFREPVVEEPCVQDLRDAMGYAIVDKNQNKNWEHRCCTVPRSQARSQPPERPLRNYSTLGPSRPERKLSRNMTDEEKENIEVDISQYIEIEDDRDLQSGEVIQKIQNRPLPAPPRPPRSRSKPLNEITSMSNVGIDEDMPEQKHHIDETEVSTQTEPLPSDFVCEEMVQEETDKIMTPSALRRNNLQNVSEREPSEEHVQIERILITPTNYSYQEETITHGQLLVEPLNGCKILPDSEISRERIIPITSDEEEISEVPEHFNKLSDTKIQSQPETVAENYPEKVEMSHPDTELLTSSTQAETETVILGTSNDMNIQSSVTSNRNMMEQQHEEIKHDEKEPERPPRSSSLKADVVDVLKTQKLLVSDLDVDRLTVNELVANKIIVSEIDSGNITSHEISSKSGTLKLADLELQPDVVRKLLEQLQESSKQRQSILEEDKPSASSNDTPNEEKKTSTNFRVLDTSVSEDSTVTLVPSDEKETSLSPSQNLIGNNNAELKNEDLPSNNVEVSTLSEDICEEQNISGCDSAADDNDIENCLSYENETEEHMEVKDADNEDSVEINAEVINEEAEILEAESSVNSSAAKNITNIEDEVVIRSEEEVPKATEDFSKSECVTQILTRNDGNVPDIQDIDAQEEIEDIEDEGPPIRPPRTIEKKQSICESKEPEEQHLESANVYYIETSEFVESPGPLQLLEPDVDDEPPPRPPQPQVPYIPSQPPASFYALRAEHYVEDESHDIPLVPRRKRHHRPTTAVKQSSSSESSSIPVPRRRFRSPEPSIPQLTGQLVGACSNVARLRLQRLIDEVNSKIPSSSDADPQKQNVQVIMVILLVLIIGLLLLGYGDGRTVHLHHWEYFNPPTDI